MDRRQFSYVAGPLDAGHYVNFVFEADPQLIVETAFQIQTRPRNLSPALPSLGQRVEKKEASPKKLAREK